MFLICSQSCVVFVVWQGTLSSLTQHTLTHCEVLGLLYLVDVKVISTWRPMIPEQNIP